jgi:hypothetical protein
MIFVLLSFEFIIIGVIIGVINGLTEIGFIFFILFAVLRSVTGVLILVNILGNYGKDLVLWF